MKRWQEQDGKWAGAIPQRLRMRPPWVTTPHGVVAGRCRAHEVADTTYAVAANSASTTPTRKGSAGTDEAVDERSRAT